MYTNCVNTVIECLPTFHILFELFICIIIMSSGDVNDNMFIISYIFMYRWMAEGWLISGIYING